MPGCAGPEEAPAGRRLLAAGRRGHLLERGGCNFSHVKGPEPAAIGHAAPSRNWPVARSKPWACPGFHPRNPWHVPTVHMNVHAGRPQARWLRGGLVLAAWTTPTMVLKKMKHFHQACKTPWHRLAKTNIPRFRSGATSTFPQAPQRSAWRAASSSMTSRTRRRRLRLIQSVGDAFIAAPTCPSCSAAKDTPLPEHERDFQAYRRGLRMSSSTWRDRGTLFGLQSGGRTESILDVDAPIVTWRYNWHPEAGTPEARLYTDFLHPRDWV